VGNLEGDVIIMGDFNASKENKFFEYWMKFCIDESFCLYDIEVLKADTYTYEHVGRGTKSWIDHIVVNNNLKSLIVGCGVLYDYVLSDHFPVYLSFEVDMGNGWCDRTPMKPGCDHYDWGKLTNEMRFACVNMLNERLYAIQCPLLDKGINDALVYKHYIDVFYQDIVECFKEICYLCVPIKKTFR
jgi:hypothetical protein